MCSAALRDRHRDSRKARLERIARVCLPALLMLVGAGAGFSQAGSLPLRPTSDYRFVAASLGAAPVGTVYRWLLNGEEAARGTVAESFYLSADGELSSPRGDRPLSTAGVSVVPGRLDRAFVAPAADLSLFTYRAPNGDEVLVRDWRAGSWHHVAFVFSEGRNFMRMYLDGHAAGDTNEGLYRAPAERAPQRLRGAPRPSRPR